MMPYKMPGNLVNHLLSNHPNLYDDRDKTRAGVEVLYAREMQEVLNRGVLPTVVQPDAYELEDGEIYDEFEEMSGTVPGATLPLLGVLPDGPAQAATTRRRTARFRPTSTTTPASTQEGRASSTQIAFPGLAVTLIIYDLETTG